VLSARAAAVVGPAAALSAGPLLRRQARRDEAVVLLYHRVSAHDDPAYPPLRPAVFEAHLDLVCRHLDVVPLRTLVTLVAEGGDLTGKAAITFDDGFRDFLDVAYPILRQRRVPVTHYLVADSVAEGRPNWNYRANVLALAGARDTALDPVRLGELHAAERTELLDGLEAAHRVPTPDDLMLRPDDLAACDEELVDWQSHGMTHALASQLAPGDLEHELCASRDRIAGWTGRPVHSFSYPNGDVDDAARAAVAATGYESAVAVGERRVEPGAPVTALPRFDVGRYAATWVPLALSGLLERARRLRR
jgi:peptidoglycan/xylan/chitin deacetylase (PgdA/CDA1 family)